MLRSVTSILTKLKPKMIKPVTFNQLVQNFGDSSVEVSSQGHFIMRVQLHPYKEDEITVVREGNHITLEARNEGVVETKTTFTDHWPYESRTTTTTTRRVSSSSSIKAFQTLVLPPNVEPSSVRTKFEKGDFVVTAKIKNSSRLPSVQNVRYFTDEEMEVSKKGDILLKVKLHPFKENEVNYRREGNIVTLEVNSNNVSETVEEVKPPPHSYTGGQKAFQTSKISKSNYAAVTYKLPLDVNEKSIKTKFENGYFILTGYLND